MTENEKESIKTYFKGEICLKEDEIKNNVASLLKGNRIILLTGSGATRCFGLPTRYELATAIKRLNNDKISEYLKEANEDVEEMLSRIELLIELACDKDGTLKNIQIDTEKVIVEKTTIDESQNSYKNALNTYKSLLQKLLGISNSRLKVFTTNYDVAFELAASELGYAINDGFLLQNKYSSASLSYDIIDEQKEHKKIDNLFYLYKLHGSLTWFKDKDKDSQIYRKDLTECKNNENPVLIYPSKEKYAQSYHSPFIDMVFRFQQAINEDNTTLIIAGYGFADDHINQMIVKALANNHKLNVIVANYKYSDENTDDKIFGDEDETNKYYRAIKDLIKNGFTRFMLVNSEFHIFEKYLPASLANEPITAELLLKSFNSQKEDKKDEQEPKI